jgi:hypothetical protein
MPPRLEPVEALERRLAFITEAAATKRILDQLGPASTGPSLARAVALEPAPDPGPEYGGDDPSYDD